MLHVRESGRGPAVVLLHAFPLNARMWEPQVQSLSSRMRLLAVDLPGFGLSPPAGAAPSLETYAERVAGALDDLRIREVLVVGLSMGGYVAFRLAERIGARLRGLLLANTRPGPDGEAAATARHELAAEVESTGVEAAANEFLPKLIGSTTLRGRPELVDRVRAIILENSPAGVAAALRAMAARPDSTPLLPALRCPVLCLSGEDDTIAPPDVARDMAAQIPDADVAVLPESGHLSNLEAADGFNDALAGLLDRCFPSRAGRG
jgi:3-oxoadipate enol-lactonase